MLDLVTLDLKLPLPTEGESYNPKLCHHISVYMFPKMNLEKKPVFGSFSLSIEEPYTIMLCPLLLALVFVLSVHPLWHRVRHRNFIFCIHMHIKYFVILTCSF